MKQFNYLLFRLYDYYHRVRKEDAGISLYFTVTASTLIIYFVFYNILTYIDFYFFKIVNQLLPNKFSIVVFIVVIGLLNYWLFIKDRNFLNYNFKSDKKGGYAIIGFIIFLALSFVFVANKNREKNFKERQSEKIENIK